MKNKHLVLLFMFILAVGFFVKRFTGSEQSPVPGVDLLRLKSSELVQIAIFRPGRQELSIDWSDMKWVATSGDRTANVASDAIRDLLAPVQPLIARTLLHTTREDTLGLTVSHRIEVQMRTASGRTESMLIGNSDSTGTWIKMPRHDGYYRVPGDLRRVFDLDFDHFRQGRPCSFTPDAVLGLSVYHPADRIFERFIRVDSLHRWVAEVASTSVAHDSMMTWLGWLQHFNQSEYADFYNEVSPKTNPSRIVLELKNDLLTLTFRRLEYLDPPEDPSTVIKPQACYILESSRHPHQYFVVYDTLLVDQVLMYLPGLPQHPVGRE